MVSNPSLVGKAEPGGDTGWDLGLWVRQLLEFGATTSLTSPIAWPGRGLSPLWWLSCTAMPSGCEFPLRSSQQHFWDALANLEDWYLGLLYGRLEGKPPTAT